MNTFLIILGILIFISLQAIVAWLVRIFDLLAWRFAVDAADAWGVLQDSVQLKIKMQQVVERIAKGHGRTWGNKIWPGKHMDPDLRSKMDKPKGNVH